MKTLRVELGSRAYDIYIGSGLLEKAGSLIHAVYGARRAVILSDDIVWELYGGILTESLKTAGIPAKSLILAHGERTKSFSNLEAVLNFLAEAGLTRRDILIAFGGGVIGDLGGFAAGCYMRGISFVQIPTTLLAQVDSSVGGKTAVNLKHGKNLAGMFWQPGLVISDTDLLASLNDREFAGGMAEVIKYGAIRSERLFERLTGFSGREDAMLFMTDIITECCDIKRAIVAKDELDTGERMILNFGHTFGHAIEKVGKYERYVHGEAVALGMLTAARYGEAAGVTEPSFRPQLYTIMKSFGLPVDDPVSAAALIPHMALDKKADADEVRLILVTKPGDCRIVPVKISALKKTAELL